MKKLLALMLVCVLAALCTACGTNTNTTTTSTSNTSNTGNVENSSSSSATTNATSNSTRNDTSSNTITTSPANKQERTPNAQSKTLVAVFSATGTTKGVADKIATIENADIYEIVPADPYSSDDLDYNDSNSRTTKEQNDKSERPAIGSSTIDLSGYSTIYIGFPIWWGEEPRIMDTFAESYNFDGITVIPFCTSSSSGIGRSGQNLEALAKSGTWLEGKRFSGDVSETELKSWIDGLKK